MRRALDGMTVVVTRPAAQSGRFIELAQAAGASCIAYPTLRIEPLALSPQTLALLRGRNWDWAIFTSANAVAACRASLAAPLALNHAAVGRATARALEQWGVPVAARPDGATSEDMLELPEFADVAGRGVLLVKGSGGRELLAAPCAHAAPRSLNSKCIGAAPSRRTPLQQRHCMPHWREPAKGPRSSSQPPAPRSCARCSITSLQRDATELRRCPLVVPGARVAAAAASQGWTGPVVQSSTAEDEAMVQAVSRLAGGALPAA